MFDVIQNTDIFITLGNITLGNTSAENKGLECTITVTSKVAQFWKALKYR